MEHLSWAGAEAPDFAGDGRDQGLAGQGGSPVPVDAVRRDVRAADCDASVLPGWQKNPDLLRAKPVAIAFVTAFWDAGKVIGAIFHAPWLLVEAGIAERRKMRSSGSIKIDLINAGALCEDSAVLTDTALVTCRMPDDVSAL